MSIIMRQVGTSTTGPELEFYNVTANKPVYRIGNGTADRDLTVITRWRNDGTPVYESIASGVSATISTVRP